MDAPDTLSDFDPAKLTIRGYCADCDHRGGVVDEQMTIPVLKARCGACGSHDTSIRICYTGRVRLGINLTQLGEDSS